MQKDFEYNAPVHVIMADIIEANEITDSGVFRKEVMIDLKDVFGRVPKSRRADVFVELLKELDERGIVFDKERFQF